MGMEPLVETYFGVEGHVEQCWLCDGTVSPSNGAGFKVRGFTEFVCWHCVAAVMAAKIESMMIKDEATGDLR